MRRADDMHTSLREIIQGGATRSLECVHAWRRGGDDAEEREQNKKKMMINNKEEE
jgi:hypothetical protein